MTWLTRKIRARWHSRKQQSLTAIFHDDGRRAYYLNGSKIKESY